MSPTKLILQSETSFSCVSSFQDRYNDDSIDVNYKITREYFARYNHKFKNNEEFFIRKMNFYAISSEEISSLEEQFLRTTLKFSRE